MRILRAVWLLVVAAPVWASGPRWVTGEPYFYPPGIPVIWYTDQPKYYTDPGDLSAYVNHAAADAMVAAASSVWNVPSARMIVSYGGLLDEQVSGGNVYLGSNGLTFPADVQATNGAAKQIAVIYDRDGSVTDLMLGSGASSPTGCRQGAVTESVDAIDTSGRIRHAVVVLNGRCTGQAPEQQLQMQYQLMRAFGRVLGLGWSQTNDNVFTGTPRPTYNQALNWPIMHPIDVICGPYTYQCMPQPFTLRADDVASISYLYPVDYYHPAANKVDTAARANRVHGTVSFPDGQGMQGVNVVVHRLEEFWDTPEDWETASSVTGFLFRRNGPNPVSGGSPGVMAANMGTARDSSLEGYYDVFRVPIPDWEGWQNLVVSMQPVNPLYTGAYAVGPYASGAVSPSGSFTKQYDGVANSYSQDILTFTSDSRASSCDSADGTESAPVAVAAQGWWSGTLCGYGHSAWTGMTVKGNRSFAVEVTALDEQGYVTTTKAMPVIGMWKASDAAGSLPSVAAAAGAFNSTIAGTTALAVQNTQPGQLRIAIADQRGDGRPDYGYQVRVLYADTIVPAVVPSAGGTVTITGTGFRAGNAVTVNGVAAAVVSWSATSIVATVPALGALHSASALTADVTVTDLVTQGSSTMTAALDYAAPAPSLSLVLAPEGAVYVGDVAAVPFAVRALAGDGSPMAGVAITFSAAGVGFGACGGASCVVVTDAAGNASTTVSAAVAGGVTLSASDAVGSVTANFTAVVRVRTLTLSRPVVYVATETAVSWVEQAMLSDNSGVTAGVGVQWQAVSWGVAFSPATTMGGGSTVVRSGLLAASATATACAWTAVCETLTVNPVAASRWRLEVVSGDAQTIAAGASFAPVVLRVTDEAENPVAGVTVAVHQTMEPWMIPCPERGRCPITPVYGSSVSSGTSDVDGLVSLVPLEATGAAEVTNIVAAAGSEGFVSLAIQKHP